MQMKRMLVTVLAVGCLVSLTWLGASLFAGSEAVAGDTSQQRWEYLVVSSKAYFAGGYLDSTPLQKAALTGFEEEALDLEVALDGVGGMGWELVTVVGIIGGDQEFIFKRPLL